MARERFTGSPIGKAKLPPEKGFPFTEYGADTEAVIGVNPFPDATPRLLVNSLTMLTEP